MATGKALCMKRVAIAGFGFMGKTHYGAWKKCRGAKVVAVCDANLANECIVLRLDFPAK